MRQECCGVEIYEHPPEGFMQQVEVVACYLEVKGHLLLLKQALHKMEPGSWGVPAGKLEPGENRLQGLMREVLEETGITLSQARDLGTLFVKRPQVSYAYHMFSVFMDDFPGVSISEEHQDYCWASRQELERINLMSGAREALSYCRKALGGT